VLAVVLLGGVSVPKADAQPLVVALWHMDESAGTVMFDSVGGHNGTLHSVQTGLPGVSGTAYGFNGSSSYVSVPSASDLNPGSSDLTFAINVQTTGTPPPLPADWDLIRKGDYNTAGGEYKMEFVQSGQASCGFKGSANYAEIIAGPAINDGQWHSIQCVKTSSAIQVVVDGQTFSQAANIGSIANTAPITIGSHPGSDWYRGSLDEASIQIGASAAPPTADFRATPTSGTAPLAVSFTDLSTGGPTAWSWDFGDGGTSTQQNPAHTYTAAGSYSVTLTASSGAGSGTTTKTNYITVTPPQPDFTVAVSPSSTVVSAGGTASYTITLTSLNGFSGSVDLSVSGLPPSSAGSFDVDPVNLPTSTSSTLTVGTSSTTKPGNYTLTIKGTGGGLTHTKTVTLQIKKK
jgi:PKD repeat protein